MDPELQREIEAHIHIETDRLISQGMSPAQARAAARRRFGNPTSTLETCYEQSRWMPGERFLQDLRYALRGMRRSPGFTTVAVTLLALGIGANTAIFSVMDAVLLKMLPIRNPQNLFIALPHADGRDQSSSYPVYRDLHDQQRSLASLFATSGETSVYRIRFPGDRYSAPAKVAVDMVSGKYFNVLGVEPRLGRFFTAEDDRNFGGSPVVVASHDFWQRQLRGDPAAVGSPIVLNSTTFTILGVAPRGFFGEAVGVGIDLWAPLTMQTAFAGEALKSRDSIWLKMFARPRDGVPLRQAEAELTALYRETMKREARPPRNMDTVYVRLIPGGKGWGGYPRLLEKPLKILMAMVGFVLLIACANIANLLLARGAARRREMGVRLALGCGRARLVRQMLTESLLLAVAGAALGLLVAQWGIRFIQALFVSAEEPIHVWIDTDWRVLAFTAAAGLLTGLLFGIAPALRASATPVASSLQAGGSRSVTGGRLWLSRSLVVTQVIFSLVVLVSAGLLVRSLRNLRGIDTGFDRTQTLVFGVNDFFNPDAKSLTPDRLRTVIERMEAVPGVRSASLSAYGLMAGARMNTEISHQDLPPGTKPIRLRVDSVSSGYFRTIGARILYGREFGVTDAGPNARAVVLSQSAARKLFGDQPPLGKLISLRPKFDAKTAFEVVGITADLRHDGLRDDSAPMLYAPLLRSGGNFQSAEFRIGAPVGTITPAIRNLFERENILVRDVLTLEERADATITMERTLASLATVFGILALAVSAAGLYGLLAYSTARRTSEIGVRLALGARQSRIVCQVLNEAVRLCALGVAVGLPVALAAARLTRSTLFGLEPTDPLTIAGTASVLLCTALLAAFVPAWRASRIDPAAALRHE